MEMITGLRGLNKKSLGTTVYDPKGFDIITVGGKQYTADQLLDKQLIASGSVNLYKSDLKTVIRTVKSGQVIGFIYSYRKASQTPNGHVVLMVYDNAGYNGTPYYVIDDAAISTSALKSQGTLTVSQQQDAYQAQQDAEANPVTSFLKNYGLKIGLSIAAVYAAVQLGKAVIEKKL